MNRQMSFSESEYASKKRSFRYHSTIMIKYCYQSLLNNSVAAVLAATLVAIPTAKADDFTSPMRIVPVSAPAMVLEAVNAGKSEGTVVSIGNPAGKPNQQWIFTPKGAGFYSIRPTHGDNLVLGAANSGAIDGTLMVLETDQGKPSQLWMIKKNDNGTVCLVPKHAPDKALDNFGGKQDAGAKEDIWDYNPGDPHVQWTLQPVAAQQAPIAHGGTLAASAPAGAPAVNGPKGQIKTIPFAESVIYPGTTRIVTVFIPAQYDGSTPACVYVRQDGYNEPEKNFLEAMIAAKQMPVTIGVFVTAGQLPAPDKAAMGRRNRSFEYDGMGDTFARFLAEEILPFVAKKLDLKLSTNGNDRCIAGTSSGGVSAFNAAWEHPDLFSRVYACSGSFAAFRGGHEFPTLIRKFEARPIRAFMTTATHDLECCAGDWFLLDQEMDKALKFSGYDYVFRSIEGNHCAGWNNYFCEAMRFIWKDWPQPVQAGSGAPRTKDVLLPGEGWQLTEQGFGDARGPTCNPAGEVFFVDAANNKCHRIGSNGKVSLFLADAGHANSLSSGSGGELYAVSSLTGQIMCYDASGKGRLVASGVHGRYILARPDGALYVSGPGVKEGDVDRVWLVQNGGSTMVDSGIKHATGLAYRPDQWLLSVADGASKWVYSYQINPDGTLLNKERFFPLLVRDWEDDAGAESVCYAQEGQMLVATRAGIQICADDGPTQVILPMPDRSRVQGVCLGGPEHNTLFAFCGDKVWQRKVKIHASDAFSPSVNLKPTPL
jgi:enterochelin esterase-like enzyme/sugar lactone lactonase YvrE